MCNYSKSLKITLQITDKNIKILDKTDEIEINGCKHLVYYGVLEASSNFCPYCQKCKIINNGYRKVKVKMPAISDKPEGDAPKPPKTEAPVEKAKGPKDEIKRLESEIAKLESDLKDAENNGAEDYFKEGLQKALDNAKNELKEILAAWLNNVTEVPEFKGGVNAVAPAVNEVPEFGANNPEIKKILDEIAKVKEQIKDGEENGAEPYYIEGLANRLNDLEEALNTLLENKPAIHEVPAFDLAKLGTAQPSTPGVDFGQKAPEVKEPAKVEAKNEKSLPNTGMNTSSTAALGLSLIALVSVAVRRKLSK